ncbi:MAG TPA: hypothetical protein VK716_16515 [Terracidiphilus sp.]|nr:hypothetical protein [Terracidiphilus sp.]
MKKLGWILALALATTPAWCAKKITVAELKDTLASMHRDNKSDTDVANALKQVELSEELTRPTMNSLVGDVPGPLSTEQIYVLEARSAMLPPPPQDIPTAAAPDAATQKAMLDKAAGYVSKTYTQLPALTATKTTVRFQDNVEAAASGSGLKGGAQDVSTGSAFVNPFQFIHYINSSDLSVASNHGAEQLPSEKDKTPWGANKMIALQEPDPSVGSIFSEAQEAGDIKWLRWELVNGKQAAVYTFTVPKKKGHLDVNVCCFPDVSQAGVANFHSASLPGSRGGASGNFQTATNWHNYKASVPYHGELFIDPDTGILVRVNVQDELKQSEVVHQLDERIDYAPVTVGSSTLVVPARTIISTEVVPNGDSGAAGAFSIRRTLFTSEYKNYQIAGGK